jgi:hypothetical protein
MFHAWQGIEIRIVNKIRKCLTDGVRNRTSLENQIPKPMHHMCSWMGESYPCHLIDWMNSTKSI